MKTAVVILAASALASAQAPAWGQCGGTGWTGPTTCVSVVQSVHPEHRLSSPYLASADLPSSHFSSPDFPPPTSPPPTSPPPTSGGNTCGSAAIDQLVGYGAGTTGGGSGAGVTVTSCDALRAAVANKGVIRISGTLTGCGRIDILGDTTLLGVGASSGLRNGGFRIRRTGNVIIRNLNFRTPAPKDDVISLDNATRVWVDHCNLSSEGMVGGKDDYDGLLDISHASDFVTVSWTKFSDHWKGSLIGHSDNNAAEDTGKLRVTYHHNLFSNVNSRLPSVRFGTGHFYSSCYENNPTSGINSRMGARVLVEQTSFTNTPLSIVTDLDSDLPGNAVERNNLFVNSPTRITQTGSFTPPYSYTTDPVSCVCSLVKARAGTGVISV